MIKKTVTEETTFKDVVNKIYDNNWCKTITVFGFRVFKHTYTFKSHVQEEDNQNNPVGFKSQK